MTGNGEMLRQMRSIALLYTAVFAEVRARHALTQLEMEVLAFLHNNPGRDTASDIVHDRMLPKANVSQAVEALIRQGELLRTPDERDRRRIHLRLTAQGLALIPDIAAARERFADALLAGFDARERQAYAEMNRRICENAGRYLERKD